MLSAFIKEIEQLRELYQKRRVFKLKNMADRMIQEAAVHNDKLKARFACLAYTMHKQLGKEHLATDPKYLPYEQKLLSLLDDCVRGLNRHAFHDVFMRTTDMIKVVNDIDLELSHYADFTYKKAQVKMASMAYAAGMSLQQSRFLTDADLKQTFSYVGFTRMHDEIPEGMTMVQRYQKLKEALRE